MPLPSLKDFSLHYRSSFNIAYVLISYIVAFILYRQHNQAGVVQQHPGLANPEISKIIGDHWRNLSPEEKNHWKLLADVNFLPHSSPYKQ